MKWAHTRAFMCYEKFYAKSYCEQLSLENVYDLLHFYDDSWLDSCMTWWTQICYIGSMTQEKLYYSIFTKSLFLFLVTSYDEGGAHRHMKTKLKVINLVIQSSWEFLIPANTFVSSTDTHSDRLLQWKRESEKAKSNAYSFFARENARLGLGFVWVKKAGARVRITTSAKLGAISFRARWWQQQKASSFRLFLPINETDFSFSRFSENRLCRS